MPTLHRMNCDNASHVKLLSEGRLAAWNSITSNLWEFILGNWWVLIVVFLFLLSSVKHSLMCWEVRRDKRRLQCCYMRHCALLHAAKQQQQQGQQQRCVKAEEKMKNAEIVAVPQGKLSTPEVAPLNAPTAASSDPVTKTMSRLERPTDPQVSSPVKTVEDGELHSRTPSLQIPLSSTSSSDLSFSLSPMSVTSRLFNRLTASPGTVDVAPGMFGDGSAKLLLSSSADLTGRRCVCFPRYTKDEQRLIDEKRQANAHAWKEAKRALESTENLASCGVTPTSSTTRQKTTTENGATVKNKSF